MQEYEDKNRSSESSDEEKLASRMIERASREVSGLSDEGIDVAHLEKRLQKARAALSEGEVSRAENIAGEVLANAMALAEIATISAKIASKKVADAALEGSGVDLETVMETFRERVLNSRDFRSRIEEIASQVIPADSPSGAVSPSAEEVASAVLKSEEFENLVFRFVEENASSGAVDGGEIKDFVSRYVGKALGKFLYSPEFERRARSINPKMKPVEIAKKEVEKVALQAAETKTREMIDSEELNGYIVRLATAVSKDHHDSLSHRMAGQLVNMIGDQVDERVRIAVEALSTETGGGLDPEEIDRRLKENFSGLRKAVEESFPRMIDSHVQKIFGDEKFKQELIGDLAPDAVEGDGVSRAEVHAMVSEKMVSVLKHFEMTAIPNLVRQVIDDREPSGVSLDEDGKGEILSLTKEELDEMIRDRAVSGLVSFLRSGKMDSILKGKLDEMKKALELDVISRLACEVTEGEDSIFREVLRDATLENVRDFMSSPEFGEMLKK